MNNIGMNLAQRHQGPAGGRMFRPTFRAYLEQERRPVPLDGGFGVVFGEAQVECTLAVGARESADASGKAVSQPRKFA